MLSRTPIGGLLLDAVEGWAFRIDNGVVAGRRSGIAGVLRIKIVAANELTHPVTHDQCFELVTEFAGVSGTRPNTRKMFESVTGPFGSASFTRGENRVRIWYCCRAPGLILGAYSWPEEAGGSSDHKIAIAQCATMVISAIFDRPSWGADDALTRVIVAAMAASDEEAADAPAPPAEGSSEQGTQHRPLSN